MIKKVAIYLLIALGWLVSMVLLFIILFVLLLLSVKWLGLEGNTPLIMAYTFIYCGFSCWPFVIWHEIYCDWF